MKKVFLFLLLAMGVLIVIVFLLSPFTTGDEWEIGKKWSLWKQGQKQTTKLDVEKYENPEASFLVEIANLIAEKLDE